MKLQHFNWITLFLLTLSVRQSSSSFLQDEEPICLRKMDVNKESLTLSGFSSGGTFVQQMQFSYAKMFQGIAVFSHTYYRCGPTNGDVEEYDNVCTKLGNFTDDKLFNANNVLIDIKNYYKDGVIENPNELKNKKLFVYAGLENFVFSVTQSLRILKIYEPFIGGQENIKTVVQNSGLVLPSNTFGGDCTGTPQKQYFIGKCSYSGPEDALRFIMAPHPIRSPKANIKLQPLLTFNQSEFFGEERNDMDTVGFIYIPKACKRGSIKESLTDDDMELQGPAKKCHLHFYFHGCRSGRLFMGNNHAVHSGYLELAEANKIITVFPQAVNATENTSGCWDTYGVTGPQHATRNGAQVQVVKKMLDRILGNN